MKAVIFAPEQGLRLVNLETPVMQPDEVILDVEACGVCGSDRQVIRGESVPQGTVFPLVMGHEVAGTVRHVGPDAGLWEKGERVIVHPFLACGTCAPCQNGQSNLCIRQGCIGFTRSGGFAEQVAVPGVQLVRCPANLPAVSAALLVDAYATPFRALMDANMTAGATVLVIGTGGLGLATLQLARSFDAAKVGTITRRQDGVQVATEFGADIVITMTEDPDRATGRALRRWSGARGVDIVIDTIAQAETVALAMEVVRPGGTVAMVGMTDEHVTLPIAKSVRRGVRLIGSYGSTKRDVETLVEWTRIDRLDPSALVAETLPLADVERAFLAGRTSGRLVIVPNQR